MLKKLKEDPRVIEYRRQYEREQRQKRKAWNALQNDDEFVIELEKLKTSLEAVYSRDPNLVLYFLSRFQYPIVYQNREIGQFLKTVPDVPIQRVFRDYTRFVAKFDVFLEYDEKTSHFRPRLASFTGPVFHFRLAKGYPQRLSGPFFDDEGYVDALASSGPAPLKTLAGLINSGDAKCVYIEDEREDLSLLQIIEDIGYQPRGLTVVIHESWRPCLFFLFGERTPKRFVREAGKILTEFQRMYFGTAKAGRRHNVKKLRKALRRMKSQKPLKEIAQELSGPGVERPMRSAQTYLSRIRRKIRPAGSPTLE